MTGYNLQAHLFSFFSILSLFNLTRVHNWTQEKQQKKPLHVRMKVPAWTEEE